MTDYELLKLCVCYDFGEAKASAKAVLVALASFYNEERGGSWPGQKDLCVRASCERKTVISAIAYLESRGIVFVERSIGRGNFYKFNVPKLKETNPEVGTSPKYGTSTENNTYAVPKTALNQSQKWDGTSAKNGTQQKQTKIEQKQINLNTGDISSCFGRFGQNPVSSPTSWEPDEEDVYDIPLRQQLAMSRKIEVDVNDTNHIPTASEIVVLAATLGYRLTHNAALDEIASRKNLTTGMLKEAIQRTKDNTGGIGYLVRILQNASKDPDAFNGIRRAPVVTAETITEAQCRSFAFKAVNAGCLAYAGESHQEAIARVEKRLKDPNYFNRNRQTLERLGLIQGAQA